MTVIPDNPSADWSDAGRNNPRYREGLVHLQAGRWQEAIQCFEAVLLECPDSETARQALADARFRSSIDASAHVRAKRWIIPWRAIVFRVLVITLIGVITYGGYRMVNRLFAPAITQAAAARHQQQLLKDGNAKLAAGDLDAAAKNYTELLALVPGQADAQKGLKEIDAARELESLYKQGVAYQEAGEFDQALQAFTDLSVKAPAYRDVAIRIAAIKKQQDLDRLFAGAEADAQAGRAADAVTKYEEILATNASFKREVIAGRLFDLYMGLGRSLIEGDHPRADDIPAAVTYFSKALALQPRSTEAQVEQRIAKLYMAGQDDYRAHAWDRAVSEFESVYAQRPDYLGGQVLGQLYEAYIRNGDDFNARQDCGYAYELYRKAAAMPVSDRSLAVQRQDQTKPCLTPTPTPSITPSPTIPPTPTPYVPPTAIPAATPPPPLTRFRNQIVFRSDNDEKAGYWVINPDGSNPRYLGQSKELDDQYKALIEREKLSPDGRYHAYVLKSESEASPQIFVQSFQKNQWGTLETWQVTHLGGENYDPVWAPNGSLIAFVSNNQGSDDIWVVNPDGTKERNYTRNEWQWDKHPTWSPDSQKIVFWSNRDGQKQLYVMDANGLNVKRLRTTKWDEYDPVWIK